jgi:hypothetical protein
MAPERWDAFRDAVRTTLAVTYGTGVGGGQYVSAGDVTTSEDAEETFLALGLVDDLASTRARLAALAAAYEQDAIGLLAVAGTDTLVPAVAQ